MADERPNIILIFTDDQGFADVGYHHADPDVRTPVMDRLAREGAKFTRAYTTAPQCIPSRAGIITSRHQNAFGLDDNLGGPLSLDETTIAKRLRDAGYATGMVGKWHLEIGHDKANNNKPFASREHLPDRHGFEDMFMGYLRQYHVNYHLDGSDVAEDIEIINIPNFRVDIQTKAALAFLDRRKDDKRPFFLYLCPYAPHSPMEPPPQYMERLDHVEEYQRRMGLASILAIDDGIGLILEKLESMGELENTIIIYMSDNGAPLREGAYIGSLNTPMIGEKGMQTDGGQRVPLFANWPGVIPAGTSSDQIVSSLDVSRTILDLGQAPIDDRVEGVNLLPWLTGKRKDTINDALYWRWRSQAGILSGDWKFIRLGKDRRYLFDMREVGKQTAADNKIDEHPEIAERLEKQLAAKADTWHKKGLPKRATRADENFYDLHVDQTVRPPLFGAGRTGEYIPWAPNRPTTPLREWCAHLLE